MELEKIELHDALLNEVIVDVIKKSVKICVDLYAESGASVRTKSIVEFTDVESISQMMNIERINKNAFAGNINYWIPEAGSTTYIYLTDGCIEIRAKTITIQN